MRYTCISVVVEPHDREEVKKLLIEAFEKTSLYWATYFKKLKNNCSVYLLPGYEYLIMKGVLGEKERDEEPLLIIGKTNVGGFKFLYPFVVNWTAVRETKKDARAYEELQSLIFVGLGRVVLPIEGKRVVAVFDWGKSIEEAFPALREAIEACFENDLKSDLFKIFEFFGEESDPVLLYLNSKLGNVRSPVLRPWESVLFKLEQEEEIVVRWGFDGEVYVNAKEKTNEVDKKILSVYKKKLALTDSLRG
mgnify:CR=1 FL=1